MPQWKGWPQGWYRYLGVPSVDRAGRRNPGSPGGLIQAQLDVGGVMADDLPITIQIIWLDDH